jgi:hypothetical protein
MTIITFVLASVFTNAYAAGNQSSSIIYLSPSTNSSVSGDSSCVIFSDNDIVAFDPVNNDWAMYFDASAVLITEALDGFSLLDEGSILLTFAKSAVVPGVGTVNPSDIIKYIPTTGTFEYYFDGSDVGLSDKGEEIDAIAVLPNGHIIISTVGSNDVSGFNVGPEDLIEFTPNSLGATTSGTFAMYLDGSDVGLVGENIDGVSLGDFGEVLVSFEDDLTTLGVSVSSADIVSFTGALGTNTSGTWAIYLDGSENAFADQNIDGLNIGNGQTVDFFRTCPTKELVELVESLGIDGGTANSLISKLENAFKSLQSDNTGSAIGALNAFINQASAQRGKKLSDAQANLLITEAQLIIDELNSQLTN